MDSFLKQLTCGAKFSKKNYNILNNKNYPNKPEIIKTEIKDEPSEEQVDITEEQDVYSKVNSWIAAQDSEEMPEHKLNLLENVPISTTNGKKCKTPKKLNKAQQIQQEQEEVNRLRNKYKVKVSIGGKKKSNLVPDIIENFEQIHQQYQLNQVVLNNLIISGYKQPTPIQMQGIPIMLEKSKMLSLMACAPTGSGKTVTFLVPIIRDILERKTKDSGKTTGLILCPTRELAKQILRECVRLTEGLPIKSQCITNNTSNQKSSKADIIVSTPSSIYQLLKEVDSNEEVSPKIGLKSLKWLIIDEADKLFEEEKNSFREQLDFIFEHCKSSKLRVALFSATSTHSVAMWCKKNVKPVAKITVGVRNSATESVDQELLFVGKEDGKLMALRNLIATGNCHPPVLIFVQSKDRAQQLFQELVYDGINVDVMHSDRSQDERDKVIREFRMGKIWFLICTELMSRGIDFKGVNMVINFDFPTSTISYVHRIGRTGRADRRGRAVTFFTMDDTVNLREVAHLIKNSGSEVPDYMLTLKRRSKMVRKRLNTNAPRRSKITTTPRFERERRAHKKQIIKQSKQKHNSIN